MTENLNFHQFQIEQLAEQIKRLGMNNVVIEYGEDDGRPELFEPSSEIDPTVNPWFTIDLKVSATVERLKLLPDDCGQTEFWRNVVDSDWSDILGQNQGIG